MNGVDYSPENPEENHRKCVSIPDLWTQIWSRTSHIVRRIKHSTVRLSKIHEADSGEVQYWASVAVMKLQTVWWRPWENVFWVTLTCCGNFHLVSWHGILQPIINPVSVEDYVGIHTRFVRSSTAMAPTCDTV